MQYATLSTQYLIILFQCAQTFPKNCQNYCLSRRLGGGFGPPGPPLVTPLTLVKDRLGVTIDLYFSTNLEFCHIIFMRAFNFH